MTTDINIMSALEAEKEEHLAKEALQQLPAPSEKKIHGKASMPYTTFHAYIRQDPGLFFRKYNKTCSCDKGDLRWDGGVVECGKCSAKLVATGE